jgi:fibronectin-binding autotransporter adhesin
MKQHRSTPIRTSTLRLGAALLLAVTLPASTRAAALNWGNAAAGGPGTWDANITTNWFDGAVDVVWPAAPGSGDDDAVFDGAAGLITIAPGGVIANDLTFNVDGYAIQGAPLTLDAGLTKPIVLTAPNTTNTINAVIAGTNGFNKYDTGTLILTASNTFYGNVQLGVPDFGGPASGVLRITQAAALGVRGDVVQPDGTTNQFVIIRADGTRLELDGSGGDITIPDHVTFITSGPNGVLRNVAGNNTINSEFVLTTGVSDTRIISDGGSLTLAGPIHVGSSTRSLILAGTNTAVNTVSGVISNAANNAATAVLKRGNNTWLITSSNLHSGNTTLGVAVNASPVVSDGILRLADSAALGTGNLIINGGYQGGSVELTGNITITNSISTLQGRQGVGFPAVRNLSGTNALTGPINVVANGSSLIFESQDGLLTIAGPAMTGSSGRSLTLRGAAQGVFAKDATTAVLNEIRKYDNGTWTLSGSNNFVNTPITANGGRFIAAHPHAFGPAGKAMSFAANGTTFELATDTPVNAVQLWTSSGSQATPIVANLVGNRSTAGPALTNNLSGLALGTYSRVNFTTGANAAGNAVFNFTTATLSGGIAGDVVLNPTSARVSISGLVTVNGTNIPKTLVLSGDATTSGHIIAGALNNSVTNTLALTKDGLSEWTLAGTSSYTGATTVSNGTLRVTGAISNSAVTVVGGTLSGTGYFGGAVAIAGGTLEPGVSTNLSEVLTINNDLTINGTALVQIGKSGATPVNDSVVGVTNITYGGTLVVTNVTGGTIVGGDAFVLFSASGTKTGNFTNIVVAPAVAGLTNTFDPATGTLTFASTAVAAPTLKFTSTGGSLEFSWTGSFKLQSQTNTLSTGIGGPWFDYPGGGSSPVDVLVDPAQPSVFFRLSQP